MTLVTINQNKKTENSSTLEKVKIDDDSDLVVGCQNGERKAQYELYKRYSNWVYNLAYRMSNDRHTAEDITQKSFMQVFSKINSFRRESAFSSWLYRVTTNVCIDELRKDKKRKEKANNELSDDKNEYHKILKDGGERFELKPYLEKAISRLPEGYKAVFILHDVEGYDHNEIGKILNIADGTSRSQLHKARKELRQRLEPYLALHRNM